MDGDDEASTPEGWNRKARGANPGKDGHDEASTLKGLNSIFVSHADCHPLHRFPVPAV
jgi:hypothetical protein